MTSDQSSVAMGQLASRSYDPGYIILSYFVSFVGCWTTLELIQRRTSRLGLYNWYLLITSSVTMGGIGIWCMHFIGNRAIILSHGESHAQIVYSSGYTAISFFLPIAVLLGAFYFIGISEGANSWRITLGGVLTGLAVCGMHYVGQLGIANYTCIYDWPHVVGAAIIAVLASLVALSIFFRLRVAWTNIWWKRAVCASILAGAVCGMHWLAASGTLYRYRGYSAQSQLSRQQIVIVVLVLSLASCALLITFAILGQRQRKRSANRAQQLVLACAFFDSTGRLMVTPEGMIPNQKITNTYVEKTFAEDEFSKTHPAFIWVFRATRNWKALRALIPGMKETLVSNAASRRYCPGNGTVIDGSVQLDTEFSTLFKQLFCVAAQDLADHVHQPLDKMGILYDDVMSTATLPADTTTAKLHRKLVAVAKANDLEKAEIPYIFGKGQFLFVVREVQKQEVILLQASGFRFAGIPAITDVLSRSMQVSREEIMFRLEAMREYSTTEKLMDPGVHVACFALRPTVRKGFDVLVQSQATNRLPHVTMPLDHISDWQYAILRRMDDWTMAECLAWLNGDTGHTLPYEQSFCKQMFRALSRLAEDIDSPFVMETRFAAKIVAAPCRPTGRESTPGKAILLCVRAITGIHALSPSARFAYRPLRLFNAQQQVYTGVDDHECFVRQIHREFADIPIRKDRRVESIKGESMIGSPPISPNTPTRPLLSPTPSPAPTRDSRAESTDKPLMSNQAFGGTRASNQSTIDAAELNKGISESSFELQEIAKVGQASFEAVEMETFVDQLYAMAVSDGRARIRKTSTEGR